jgi:UDP-N-acetylglucosamine 3-dehydrogenase
MGAMAVFRVGVIGTGRPEKPSKAGYGMAYKHGPAYQALPEQCEMVACADIVQENADAFAQEFGVPRTYRDYHEMLAGEQPDIVSICTWPHLHEPMVVDCAEAGVRAIHCEKPMATTWGACKHMAEVCEQTGVQLTFNHQRRFGTPFRAAKKLLDDGRIGNLVRLEFGMFNLCDYGSHNFDLCGYFNDQSPPEWVMAQIDYRTEDLFFGMPNENQAIAMWKYVNGVYGHCITGPREASLPFHNRLLGTDGVIEVGPRQEGMPVLRVKAAGSGEWESVDCGGETCHGPGFHERAIAQLVQCLADGTTPELCAANALQSTELLFGCWESARRRGRVDLPLDIEDNPLVAMVESGDLKPAKAD